MSTYYSNGKLLLTGEYLVLDEAKALALPTRFGQNLSIEAYNEPKLIWESYTDDNDLWLQVAFDLPRLRIINASFDSSKDGGYDSLAERLQNILLEAKKLNPDFLSSEQGFYVKSKLTFPRNWGLGSSSTLINNIAQWANVDAYQLQFNTLGGSAYDIACAQHNDPIIYQLKNEKPVVETINFDPDFKDQLYFVHLNKKQNSRDGIAQYKSFKGNVSAFAEKISSLTYAVVKCLSLSDFEKIIIEHEQIISSIIKKKTNSTRVVCRLFRTNKKLRGMGW